MDADDKRFAFEEAFNLLCGDLIASGMSRHVYTCPIVPDCVVKVEARPWFQNVQEDHVWHRVSETKFGQWFAPVRWLSPYGRVLVMERTMPVGMTELPKKVPAFFTDLKRQNWGRLPNGRIVCHDYGTHLMLERGMTSAMRTADWYEG